MPIRSATCTVVRRGQAAARRRGDDQAAVPAHGAFSGGEPTISRIFLESVAYARSAATSAQAATNASGSPAQIRARRPPRCGLRIVFAVRRRRRGSAPEGRQPVRGETARYREPPSGGRRAGRHHRPRITDDLVAVVARRREPDNSRVVPAGVVTRAATRTSTTRRARRRIMPSHSPTSQTGPPAAARLAPLPAVVRCPTSTRSAGRRRLGLDEAGAILTAHGHGAAGQQEDQAVAPLQSSTTSSG